MQTSMTYTEEQFKKSIIDTFNAQVAKAHNIPPIDLALDKLNVTVYTKEQPSVPNEIDKITIEFEF